MRLLLPVAALATITLFGVGADGLRQPDAAERFTVERLADGVYAVMTQKPAGLFFETSSLVVIGERDIAVVDAQFSRAATLRVLAEIRRLSRKPVRYVINTHYHDDHITGNQVYADSFPGVEFVAHEFMRDDMASIGGQNRQQFASALPGTLGFFRGLLQQGKSFDGSPISAEERVAFAADSLLGTRFLAEYPTLRTIPPTRTFSDRLVLDLGGRAVEVRYLGKGHTRGDAVVVLPAEGIVAAGDLVVWPVPTIGSTSLPAGFGATLEGLLALRPRVILPAHGPVMHDDAHVRQTIRLLGAIRSQVDAAVARGDSLPAVRKAVDLSEFRRAFAGESALRGIIFDQYVTGPGVAAAYREARDRGT